MHRSLISTAILTLAGLCAVPAPALAGAPARLAAAGVTTQLPRNVRPLHYDVALTPDAGAATFSASVTISIEVLEPTAAITLNATELAFQRATLTPATGARAATAHASATATVSVDAARQTATFRFERPVAKGRYLLTLDYTGLIGTQAVGMFALDYDSAEGKKRALYTQFENSDARRVIPSWDEPNYKATFDLRVTVPAGQMAVSNMPVASTTPLADGRKLVRFGTSPKMSTYLLFFGLGEFERASAMVDGTEVGVITKKGALAQAAFPLESAKAVLREYNDYFGVRYPLPKLDNVAAPGRSQFFGAMENWGAIFTFEYAMLLDPAISNQHDKEASFSIAAHEMAHQWFGDLVTMRWWDDLWLNEGFASWMESRTTARLHPEWHTALSAVAGRERAMGQDSLATTHPVVQHVDTVEQASQAFDSITYAKGEAVIRMLENYVGEDAWRAGVRAYIRAHAYGNTVTDDLWAAVEQAAHKPVRAIAHDFTLQPGVPMLRVDSVTCQGGQTRLALSQGEFSRDQTGKAPRAWRVPVTVQLAGGGSPVRALVSGGQASVTLPGCGPVLVNAGQTGYFRTLYAAPAFAALAARFGQLSAIDQLGLLGDASQLGLAGLQPMSDVLDLAAATPADADPQVWERLASFFADTHRALEASPQRQQNLSRYAIARLAPIMQRTGWTARAGEAADVANLRERLIDTLSELGDGATIAEARHRYAAQASDPAAMPGNLRQTIMWVVARHADQATWDQLHAAARGEASPMIKDKLYELLAAAADPALARQGLQLALGEEPGATTGAAMLSTVAMHHPDLAFDFAIAHMEQVNERIDATSRSRYFPRLAGASADPAMLAKLNAYADAHLAASARRATDAAIAGIAYRIKVRAERLPAVDAWLAQHGGAGAQAQGAGQPSGGMQ